MTKGKKIDIGKLTELADEIARAGTGSFIDLRHRLETEEGMKLVPIRGGAGGSTCRLAGITATCTAGDHGAVMNWAAAARRAVLAAGTDIAEQGGE